MDATSLRGAASAAYRRSPDRSRGPTTRPAGSNQPAANRARYDQSETADPADEVKQDQLWKETVFKERRAAREWENNWNFLKCDYMGQLRKEEHLPTHRISFFSDGPNTTSQMFSSRLSSPLGRELIRLDRSCLWPRSFQHKHKPDPEKVL